MRIKTLVLDDAKDICYLIRRVAEKMGHDVAVESRAVHIKSLYQEYQPDIILLDLQMPGMDGIEILRMLAKNKSNSAIAIVSGVHGEILQSTMELGKKMGLNMIGVLSKPLDLDRLREILAKKPHDRIEQIYEIEDISEEEILQAVENDRILVYYQPKIDIDSGKVIGVEALIRMLDKNMKIITPDQFIQLAEETGLIDSLTYRVIEITLQEMETWCDIFPDTSAISVNISPYLLSDLDIPDRLEQIIYSYHSNPYRYILEITESAMLDDHINTMDVLSRLRLKGFRLSIDDFGTGYSNYKNLFHQLFHELKIDKSFVRQASGNKYAAMIVKSVIELSQKFNLDVVAEGIEDEKSLNWLASINCKIGQGYYICRPIPANQFKSWLKQYRCNNKINVLA